MKVVFKQLIANIADGTNADGTHAEFMRNFGQKSVWFDGL